MVPCLYFVSLKLDIFDAMVFRACFLRNIARPVTRGALENSCPLQKCVGRSLKILDIVQKIWAPLGKLFAPPGVQRWLRACVEQSIVS